MKTFSHSNEKQVRLKVNRNIFAGMPKEFEGRIFTIIACENCSGKKAWSPVPCNKGGDPKCPGYIVLDEFPNRAPQCYSWGGECVFEFLE